MCVYICVLARQAGVFNDLRTGKWGEATRPMHMYMCKCMRMYMYAYTHMCLIVYTDLLPYLFLVSYIHADVGVLSGSQTRMLIHV